MTTDYEPIDCDQHSVLELLAMRRTPAVVDHNNDHGEAVRCRGTIVDVLTHDRAEFLVVEESPGHRTELRLDQLSLIRGADGQVVWRQESDVTR